MIHRCVTISRDATVGLFFLCACIGLFACTSPVSDPGEQSSLELETTQENPTRVPPWEAPDVRSAYSRGGTFLVKWRPSHGRLPKNEHFQVDLWVFERSEDGKEFVPVDGAKVGVAGWMPAHGHGMIRQPRVEGLGNGFYSVTGMLFHMGGEWQLFFDLIVDGVSERTLFDVSL